MLSAKMVVIIIGLVLMYLGSYVGQARGVNLFYFGFTTVLVGVLVVN